jgi:hypothetical protein
LIDISSSHGLQTTHPTLFDRIEDILPNDKVEREIMSFLLSQATPADASSIASVHLAAFDSNPLLHVQFPSVSSIHSLHEFLVQNTVKDLSDPGKAVLIVRDRQRVVGFASWELPGAGGSWEGLEWPADCSKKWLDEYYEKARGVRARVVGERKCYGKIFFDFTCKLCGVLLSCYSFALWYRDIHLETLFYC